MIIGEERAMINTIRKGQWEWIEQTLGGDFLLRTVIEGKNENRERMTFRHHGISLFTKLELLYTIHIGPNS